MIEDREALGYDVTTGLQIAIAIFCAGVIVLISAMRNLRQKVEVGPLVLGLLALMFLADQTWWSFAREAYSDKHWIQLFASNLGIDAKVFFESASYVMVIKAGLLAAWAMIFASIAQRFAPIGWARGFSVACGLACLAVIASALVTR